MSKPLFYVCSFEALVVAILRRLDIGDFAHQSVREQLHRPVYTIQVKERCAYHDSLAIQYCCRAINHGFCRFLDGFIRQRFIQALPEQIQNETSNQTLSEIPPTNSFLHDEKRTNNNSTSLEIDSINSIYIEKQRGLHLRAQQEKVIEALLCFRSLT